MCLFLFQSPPSCDEYNLGCLHQVVGGSRTQKSSMSTRRTYRSILTQLLAATSSASVINSVVELCRNRYFFVQIWELATLMCLFLFQSPPSCKWMHPWLSSPSGVWWVFDDKGSGFSAFALPWQRSFSELCSLVVNGRFRSLGLSDVSKQESHLACWSLSE